MIKIKIKSLDRNPDEDCPYGRNVLVGLTDCSQNLQNTDGLVLKSEP